MSPRRHRSAAGHPVFARVWQRIAPRVVDPQLRRELLAGLAGRVVEIGAGTGTNFAHYPLTVDEVLAVEPEPHLRALAERAAATAPVRVTVMDATAQSLPAADGSCDAAVVSLVLCSVPDQREALAELHRVLRPAGQLRFYEHVVSRHPWAATLQRLLDRSGVWPALAAGCHLARDTLAAIRAAGFIVEHVHRHTAGAIPHIRGFARRAAG